MVADSLEVIYVGASDNFRWLQPDEKGLMQYVSLAKSVIGRRRRFAEIRKTLASTRVFTNGKSISYPTGLMLLCNRFSTEQL